MLAPPTAAPARPAPARLAHRRRCNNLDAYVDDLLSILDALRIPRCAFFGHSVSAMISILASIRRPDLFAKLVLIGASPRFLNDSDYHGGFELEQIQQVFDAMSANYAAWATGYAPLAVGADVLAAVQEFSRTLFNMRPDISPTSARACSRPTSAACWAWCRRRASSCRPPATFRPGLRRRVPRPTSAAAPPSSPCRRRATSPTSAPPASSPRCSAARSPGSSSRKYTKKREETTAA
ncbi:hypothetical protein ZWY2020_017164 [Hordeum vulgare]|nr:hypothetical protein ZWY2020_017164 [Hordeum vulgare]